VTVAAPGADAAAVAGAQAGDRPMPGREPLPDLVLADIARGFAAAVPLWSTLVRHDPAGRWPVRLIAAERYEVWVIGWTTGQNVRLHDHGDSVGALVVTEGELTEVLPGGRSGPAIERTLETARLRHLALGTVHDVVNRAPAPATSIHVYSPPLTSMTYYDPDTFEPVDTESVEETTTALAPDTGAVVLHPSTRPTR
jgi:predicted metal-dependent enzyme (double-stranded beta helix superfamily)